MTINEEQRRRAEARQAPLPAGTVTEDARRLRQIADFHLSNSAQAAEGLFSIAERLEAAFAARPVEPVAVKCGDGVERTLIEWLRMFRKMTRDTGFFWMAEDAEKFLSMMMLVSTPAPGLVERVCSIHGDRRGPSKRSGHKDGGRSRDPFHLRSVGSDTTFCGRNSGEWLLIDKMNASEAATKSDCCVRCAALSSITETGGAKNG